MKCSVLFRILLCCLLCLGAALPAHADGAVPLATGEWAPFTSQTAPGQGEVTTLVRKVFARMGLEPRIEFFPWRRCYDMVLSGETWGAFPYSWTEDRAKEVLFSDPVGRSDTGWFYVGKAPIARYTSLKDVAGVSVGGVDGYFYKEELERAGIHAEYSPDELSALRMLLAGHVDLVPMNVLVVKNLLDQHFPEQRDAFGLLEGLYSSNQLCMIVSPSYPKARALLDAFNAALAQVGNAE